MAYFFIITMHDDETQTEMLDSDELDMLEELSPREIAVLEALQTKGAATAEEIARHLDKKPTS